MPSSTRFRSLPLGISLAVAGAASSLHADVLANHLGWPVKSHKTVVLTAGSQASPGATWTLTKSGSSAAVATGPVGAAQGWSMMGNDQAQVVVLPDSLDAGSYKLSAGSAQLDFQVQDQAWLAVSKALLKGFYFQRAGMELTSQYAGSWARQAAHVDGKATYHPSSGKSSGSKNSPKGWYDAGDYNKYIVNSGITTWCLLALAEQFKPYADTLKLGIPEDGGPVPALLAEARWNLDWMLTMQDDDGGVFHKWTQKEFGDFALPHLDKSERFFVGKSSNASYDFAAVMAMASRLYASSDATFAASALAAAKKAYAWGVANHGSVFKNPSDVLTGEYGDTSADDEKFWAAVELAIATGEASYVPTGVRTWSLPWWKEVGMLGDYGIVSHPQVFPAEVVAKAQKDIVTLATDYAQRVKSGPWAALQQEESELPWGSNSVLSHMGIHGIYAWLATGNTDFLDVADVAMDNILGRNPLGLSGVTGFGKKKAMKIHHRISGGDNVVDPVPGLLIGGPYAGGDDVINDPKNTWMCKEYRVTGKPALAWIDDQCSYATNEIAINWNASSSYLANALTAIHQKGFKAPAWSITGVRRVARPVELRWNGDALVLDRAATVQAIDARGVRGATVQAKAGEPVLLERSRGVQMVLVKSEGAEPRTFKRVSP